MTNHTTEIFKVQFPSQPASITTTPATALAAVNATAGKHLLTTSFTPPASTTTTPSDDNNSPSDHDGGGCQCNRR